MAPRSVFFDFGGTLCRSLADLRAVFREAAERAGTRIPEDAYVRANEACWDELWPSAPSLVGQIPSFADRVHEMALRRIGFVGPSDAVVRNIREAATSPRWHEPFPETEATLRHLFALGTPMHVLSGSVDYLPILLANLGWMGYFRTVTFTQEVGVQKPDARVFRFALGRAGQAPADAVYVGDSWEADYVGAQNAGLSAVWLNRTGRPAPGPCRQIGSLRELPRVLADLEP